jgi:hypothetical protein
VITAHHVADELNSYCGISILIPFMVYTVYTDITFISKTVGSLKIIEDAKAAEVARASPCFWRLSKIGLDLRKIIDVAR